MKNYSYGKLVLKEVLRLHPVSVGISRLLQRDCVFSGYHVPAGTLAVTMNQVICRFAEHFDRPDEFLPERWEERGRYHAHLSLPFGFGPRMCIGRRLAEQGMLILMHDLVERFEFEWNDLGNETELDCLTLPINKPDRPITFNLRKIGGK